MKSVISKSMLPVMMVLTSLSCSDDSTCADSKVCEGVTCSGHGVCAASNAGTAICVCNKGYYTSQAGTECLEEGSSDPCEGVTCSDHGICTIDNDEAFCDCEDGFTAQGLSCLPESEAQSFFAVPTYIKLSNAGGYVAYVEMEPTADGNGREFASGDFVVQDVETHAQTVIEPSIEMITNQAGTFFPVLFQFDEADQKMVYVRTDRDTTTTSVPGSLIDLATGKKTPLGKLGAWEHFATFAPDLGWGLVLKQTYHAAHGAIKLMKPLTTDSTLISETCTDPHLNKTVDGMTVGNTTYIAAASCTRANSTTTWSLKIYQDPSAGDPVEIAQVETKALYIRPNGIAYEIQGANAKEVYFAALTGGTPLLLGEGDLKSISPSGSWVLITWVSDGGIQGKLVKYDGSAERSLGAIRTPTWTGQDTLYYGTSDNELTRVVDGAAPEDLTTAGVSAILPLDNDRVWGVIGGPEFLYSLVVQDDNGKTITVGLPTMRQAFVVDSSGVKSLGSGSYWQVSSRYVLRGDFYYDVLRGGIPSPDNGFYLYIP
ncbi:MAG: hypothetical protein J7M25_08625 [Deltaproteobacteria bacterium]|nr:hypothetical protein [Deltaproteobacteria bacterium]